MSGKKLTTVEIKQQVTSIVTGGVSSIEEKIAKLTTLREDLGSNIDDLSASTIDNAIEDVFGEELRRLNAIRERNLEMVKLQDIEILKDGFATLFTLIDKTLDWNVERKSSMEGVINRASLRAMLIDPAVSVKTKQDIMNNWEDYM